MIRTALFFPVHSEILGLHKACKMKLTSRLVGMLMSLFSWLSLELVEEENQGDQRLVGHKQSSKCEI